MKRTKEANEKYEKEKWEHQEWMKAKEQEKERQMKEQVKMKGSPAKNVAAVSSVTVKTEHGCITIVEQVADIMKGDKSETAQKVDD